MKLSEIARLLGGRLLGEPDTEVSGVAGLEEATAQDITYATRAHLKDALSTQAACVLLQEPLEGLRKPQIIVEDPPMAFLKLLEHFHPPKAPEPGVSPLAHVAPDAQLGEAVTLYPFSYVGPKAKVGSHSVLYPGAVLLEGSELGEHSVLYANVVVGPGVKIGSKVVVHASSVIGSDGFGYLSREGRHIKIPQVGTVVVEDEVEIGAGCTIDRATTGATVIGRGTKIDNLVQIAHNVKIGPHCLIVAQAGVAGSSSLGAYTVLAGQAGVADHVSIEGGTVIGAQSGVLPRSSLARGAWAGTPVMPHRQWLRVCALLQRLPQLHQELKELKKQLSEIERRLSNAQRNRD